MYNVLFVQTNYVKFHRQMATRCSFKIIIAIIISTSNENYSHNEVINNAEGWENFHVMLIIRNHAFRVMYQLVPYTLRTITCINWHRFNYQISAIGRCVNIRLWSKFSNNQRRRYVLERKRASKQRPLRRTFGRSMWDAHVYVCVCVCTLYINNQLNYRQTRRRRRRSNLRFDCPNRNSDAQL